MASERLYRILPELCDELNVDAILPYLMSHDVISIENFEKLCIAKERKTRRQLVLSLMPMIRCPQLFVFALEESQKDEPVHATLVKRLREKLNDASSAGTCTDVLRPATSLDQPCSEADLLKCARALQSWEEIWMSLGLTYPETMELKHSYGYDYREQKFQMFMLWKRKYGSCANYKTLLQAAQSIHDQQFTAFVRQLLSKVGTD